jgi:hypothetical protein
MVDDIPDAWCDVLMSAASPRPPSPGSSTIKQLDFKPSDLDPELQTLAMVDNMRKELDPPSEISKLFAVRKAIYASINHTEANPTGYDASLRLAVYSSYEKSSLNIDAKFFNSFMAFLMKPKMIIQGMPTAQQPSDEPGFVQRMISRLRGQDPQPTPQAKQ